MIGMHDYPNATFVRADKYIHDLHTICGEFELSTQDNKGMIWGGLAIQKNAGVELAHVATNLHSAVRTLKNIRNDFGENYFLIMQQYGKALMSQNDVSTLLLPGDLVLIDSSKPSEFRFFGEQAKQVSIHLPRHQIYDRFAQDLRGGAVISQKNPNTRALRSVIEILASDTKTDIGNNYLKDALFGLIGLSIFEDFEIGNTTKVDSPKFDGALLSKMLDCIKTNFRDPEFSVVKMAGAHCVTVRKMQRLFERSGVTPTKILLSKRLEYARQRVEGRRQSLTSEPISSIAYDAGFSDVSYFNRRFKEIYECSPREYLNSMVDT